MSENETPDVPARRDRRDAVREKAAQVHAKQRRGTALRIAVISVLGVAVVGAVGVAVAWVLISQATQRQPVPTGMEGDAFVVDSLSAGTLAAFSSPESTAAATPSVEASAAATEPVRIDVYVDYMAEESAQFQTANAKQLAEWVTQGAATIAYHPVALLTAKSNGTKYSLRAAAAAACVGTYSPDAFFAFNHALLSDKPEPESDGYSNDELADIAIASSASKPRLVRACIEDEDFSSWAQAATASALSEDVGETGEPLTGPTVLVNGERYAGALDDAKEFAQFVLTLASDAYYATPSPTPTATVEPSPAG